MTRIVLPQAVTRMLPPMGSQFITLFKDSALVSLVTLQDLMWSAQSLAAFTLRTVEVLTVVAFIYMALTHPAGLHRQPPPPALRGGLRSRGHDEVRVSLRGGVGVD